MIQTFVKFENYPTMVLNLEDNYTISSKELYVKCCELYFKRFHNKSLMDGINNGLAEFIVNSHMSFQCKMIKFRSNMYWNTNQFKDSTLYFGFSAHYTNLNKEDIESINNIVNGYY